MNQKQALDALVSYLSGQLSVPVFVKGTRNERPTPAVVIENWSTTEFTYHNDDYVGLFEDPADGVEKEYYRFYWGMRVELLIRHTDDVDGVQLDDAARDALRLLRTNSSLLHDHARTISLGNGGGINHQFVETPEAELNQALTINGLHDLKIGPANSQFHRRVRGRSVAGIAATVAGRGRTITYAYHVEPTTLRYEPRGTRRRDSLGRRVDRRARRRHGNDARGNRAGSRGRRHGPAGRGDCRRRVTALFSQSSTAE